MRSVSLEGVESFVTGVRLYQTFSIYFVTGITRCVQGAYALVRGGSSTSNLIEPSQTTSSQIGRYVDFFPMPSGSQISSIIMYMYNFTIWYDYTAPHSDDVHRSARVFRNAHLEFVNNKYTNV